MVIEISVAVIAFAFVVLVIYLVITLIGVRKTLKNVDRTLLEFHHEIRGLTQTTNKVAENILFKAQSLDPLFNSLHEVGTVAEKKAENYRLSAVADRNESIEQVVQIAAIGLNLWQKFKKGRRS